MIEGKKVLAIIPARAGSKRVKDKNIRLLGGIPLIQHTLKDLYKSKYIDHSFVSTDSEKIQAIANLLNIEATPLRSEVLSSDHATSADVILDIVLNIKREFDIIILLQPTSPFRSILDIDKALELYIAKNAKSVVSVCEAECHPSWVGAIGEDLKMDLIVKNLQIKRSQDLDKFYKLNGAIYIMGVCDFIKEKSFYLHDGTYSFVMDRKNSIDIDTEEDLKIAENFLKTEYGNEFRK